MKQIFHPAQKWEEYAAGMWRQVTNQDERNRFIEAAADLMREPDEFLKAMVKAVNEWPISCEHQLTNQSINHQAWMGHAGCCIETQSPEDCTRLGWHTLTKDEQDAANDAADKAYAIWKDKYRKESNMQNDEIETVENVPTIKLTAPDPAFEEMRKNTPMGMAHWSGTGPDGKTCGECLSYGYQYENGSGKLINRKSACKKYRKMAHRHGESLDKDQASCRYFEAK